MRILTAVGRGATTEAALSSELGIESDAVGLAVGWALDERLLERRPSSGPDGGVGLRLTERGEGVRDTYPTLAALAAPRAPTPPGPPGAPWTARRPGLSALDLQDLATRVGGLGVAARQGRESAVERARAGHLIDPTDRDHAVEVINRAYTRGAMDLTEREHRVGVALAARTRGALGEAVTGLGPTSLVLPAPATVAAARRAQLNQRMGQASVELRRTLLAVAAAGAALTAVLIAVIVLVLVLNR